MAHRFKTELIILSVYQVAYLDAISDKIDLDAHVENIRLGVMMK